jgi:hypothetical protein
MMNNKSVFHDLTDNGGLAQTIKAEALGKLAINPSCISTAINLILSRCSEVRTLKQFFKDWELRPRALLTTFEAS